MLENSTIKNQLKKLIDIGVKTKASKWQGTDDYSNFDMLILQNEQLSFKVPNTEKELIEFCKPDIDWVREHFEERVGGEPTNPGKSYLNWPYHQKLDNDSRFKTETFSHTYQERFWPRLANIIENDKPNEGIRYGLGDLNDVIKLLIDNPNTRQAYLPIFFPEDTGAVLGQRVPCTLGYLFYLDYYSRLSVNYYIRSCDAYRHLRNDIYFTARLLQYVSEKTGIEKIGVCNMYIANLHIFVNDIYAFNKKEKNL
jgi:thymidylate synthase